jgi:DNA (cytosine-5)-methyltransferase 1
MPRILDLFCGAGGAAAGYASAGWEVHGVDIAPQPHYPYAFTRGDALSYLDENGHRYDAVHASPPCQHYSKATRRWAGAPASHPDLVSAVRERLRDLGLPYIIENVTHAPLVSPVVLCGSMFGLGVRRHRLFEASFPVPSPPACDHASHVW